MADSNQNDPALPHEDKDVRAPWRNRNRTNGEYPVIQYEWRITGDLLPETDSFDEAVSQEYSRENAKKVVERGDAMAKAAGSLEEALSQLQAPESRKLNTQWNFINEKKQWVDGLAEEMMGGNGNRSHIALHQTTAASSAEKRFTVPGQRSRRHDARIAGLYC